MIAIPLSESKTADALRVHLNRKLEALNFTEDQIQQLPITSDEGSNVLKLGEPGTIIILKQVIGEISEYHVRCNCHLGNILVKRATVDYKNNDQLTPLQSAAKAKRKEIRECLDVLRAFISDAR